MRLLPLASDAWRFVLPLTALGIGLQLTGGWLGPSVGILCLLAAVFCAFFFRDFDRDTVIDDALIYSPGDGTVLEVVNVDAGPHHGWKLVRIFLSVLDGHVQRSPIAGTVETVVYTKGLFLDARHLEAHVRNEQSAMTIKGKRGSLVLTQIAGLIARRIVCWVKPGQELKQGERYGLIRFGSQVDVLFPPQSEVTIKVGDRVLGGLTVIGHWK